MNAIGTSAGSQIIAVIARAIHKHVSEIYRKLALNLRINPANSLVRAAATV